MRHLLLRQIDVLWDIGFGMIVGTVLAVVCVVAGWLLSLRTRGGPTRLVAWWVRHVVDRIVRAASWRRRCAGIFVNNTAVTALLVALGVWTVAAWAGIVCLGLSLGIGLQVMTRRPDAFGMMTNPVDAGAARRIRVGVTLNMLEPPAIAIAIGLSLGRNALPAALSASQSWETFALCVVPLLLLAACGEALWLDATIRRVDATPKDAPPEGGVPGCPD